MTAISHPESQGASPTPTPPASRVPPGERRPFGLYIHIPFCEKKCPYCDFNTYAGLNNLFAPTVAALCQELADWGQRLDKPMVDTIFVGGGTPTLLDAPLLTQIFDTVRQWFRPTAGCEITSEANPGTVDREKFGRLRELGVNRLSMGVQSFLPHELTFLGRIHDTEDVYQAFAAARAAGFDNINLDFIFGLPGQDAESWQQSLTAALTLRPEHLSLYSLIVEPDTPLHHWVESGHTPAPDEDVAADLYEQAMARLGAAGYTHYEVSNWANTSGSPAPIGSMPALACRHNLIYWRNQEYVGIGPGAHSHLRLIGSQGVEEVRWANHRSVPGYNRRIRNGESVEVMREVISPRMAMGETMMTGLRLVGEGVSRRRFAHRHGVEMQAVFGAELAQLKDWGLLYVDEEQVRLTPRGLLLGNQIFMRFLDS